MGCGTGCGLGSVTCPSTSSGTVVHDRCSDSSVAVSNIHARVTATWYGGDHTEYRFVGAGAAADGTAAGQQLCARCCVWDGCESDGGVSIHDGAGC